jgi:hypothetical protein
MAKKKEKETKHSTSLKSLSISCTAMDMMNAAHRMFPENGAWRERLCYTLIESARDPEILEIIDFCNQFGMPYRTLRHYADKFPDVGEAYEYFKLNIAGRRRKGALVGKYNVIAAYKDVHRYDPEWVGLMKELSDIKENTPPSNIVVVKENLDPEYLEWKAKHGKKN